MNRSIPQSAFSSVRKLAIAVCVTLMVCVVFCANASASTLICPFCSAVALTLTEQMESKDVVVSARLKLIPEIPDDATELPKAEFEIVKVLRGGEILQSGMTFKATLIGRHPIGQEFFVMGVDPPNINWTTPMKATPRLLVYLERLGSLPKNGPDRLVFFQDYFEDKESTLAFDAYDEFANAPYDELIQLKDRMDRERLIEFIKSDETSDNRRRLYLTLLGVCGQKGDADFLEDLLRSGSSKKMRGLNALIACYLNLKGDPGVDLVEELFLANPECEYTETMQAVSALRFHGTETDVISKDRIVKAVRHVLDRKEMADMIVPDLARWEDWTVMDRLVQMFKDSSEEDNWIRVPVVSYLHACPKPEAKAYIEELRKIDPNSVARAEYFITDYDDDEDEDEEDSDDDEAESGSAEPGSADAEEQPAAEGSGSSVNVSTESKTEFVGLTTSPLNNPQLLDDSVSEDTHTVRRVDLLESDDQLADPDATGTLAIGTKDSVGSLEETANQIPETFVVNRAVESLADEQLAQSPVPSQPDLATAPVAAAAPNLTWYIIVVPMVISVLLFMLLWSVVSGWFERLIF